MSGRVGTPAVVGMSVWPNRIEAVVLQGGGVRSVAPRDGGFDALPELLKDCVQLVSGGRSAVEAVTVDLSPLLLDAICGDAPTPPRVAVVRIVPQPAADPVLATSSATLERLVARRYTVRGGHDLLGAELTPLDLRAVGELCDDLRRDELDTVALVAAGSQAQPEHERAVADAVLAAVPSARVAAASDYGGYGLATREATVLLDSALAGLVDRLVDHCERAVARTAPHAALRIARGDGGWCAPFYVRALPAITLGARDALLLTGAAHDAAEPDCRVELAGPGTGTTTGEVRGALPVIRAGDESGAIAALGLAVAMPTAVLVHSSRPAPEATLPVVRPVRDPAELVCIGAAVSRPTSWLDEIGLIRTGDELARARRRLVQRATAIVMANGAAPGSPFVADESAVAVPYSPSGTVRLRVRVVGSTESAPVTQAAL